MISTTVEAWFPLAAAFTTSASITWMLIVLMKPLLIRYALARPNARSSHTIPTPQGGGIAVVSAALIVTGVVLPALGVPGNFLMSFLAIAAASIMLALVGAVDDIRPLPAAPRFVLQMIAVAAIVFAADIRLFPSVVPHSLERAILILAGTWFVNLVNFMDGLDWITVAEIVPITAAIASFGFAGFLPTPVIFAATALCGALLGFAPFNKPVARLFLGDVGSLPIGLLVGWMLLELAGWGTLAAALLLPMYHLMDATITLLLRLARGEKVWEAHRSHFYQQATTNGFSALSVSTHVFALNIMLAGLAAVTLRWSAWPVQVSCLLAGVVLVGLLLSHFARPQSRP